VIGRGVRHGTLGLCIDTSGRSRDRHVRSSAREATKHARSIGRGSVSGHDRPDASGHEWVLIGNDPTLALWHPVCQACASGRGFTRAGYA
jgi:hypothetical protein